MRQTLLSLAALFIAVLLMMLGNGLLGSLLGLKLAQGERPPFAAGLVMACYYGGLVLGALLCQGVVRRVGHIRAFAAFGAINCAAVMLLALQVNVLAWALIRVATGVAMMGLYMVIESWLAERADREIRGRVFSFYMLISYAGLGGGQFLLGLDEPGGLRLFLVAGLLFSLCMVPVTLTRAMHPRPVEATPFNLMRLMKLAPFGVLGCLAAGLINGSFYALGPAFAHGHGLDVGGVAAFMAATIFGGLLLQWPVGLLSDRHDRRSVLALLGLVVCGLSLLYLPAGSRLGWLVPLALLWGGLAFTIYPVSVAHANDHIEPQDIVPASGALILAYGIGAAVGPLLSGALMGLLGSSGLYLFTAGVAAALAAAVYWHHEREPVSVAEQSPYLPVPRTSQVITQLDPRAEGE